MSALTDFCAPFPSSFLFLTSRYSCLGAVLSCVPTLTNLSLSLYHHITEFQAYDGSASSLFDIHLQSIISSKFCFVRLFGLNLTTKQLRCFSDHWNRHISHFLCKSRKKAAAKLSLILLKQHIEASWVSANFFPDLWIKHGNSENHAICAWIMEEVLLWEISWWHSFSCRA